MKFHFVRVYESIEQFMCLDVIAALSYFTVISTLQLKYMMIYMKLYLTSDILFYMIIFYMILYTIYMCIYVYEYGYMYIWCIY